jgi:hypothetical protein
MHVKQHPLVSSKAGMEPHGMIQWCNNLIVCIILMTSNMISMINRMLTFKSGLPIEIPWGSKLVLHNPQSLLNAATHRCILGSASDNGILAFIHTSLRGICLLGLKKQSGSTTRQSIGKGVSNAFMIPCFLRSGNRGSRSTSWSLSSWFIRVSGSGAVGMGRSWNSVDSSGRW